jgi:pimeloyl-ACP methyl ester carboxylesterase
LTEATLPTSDPEPTRFPRTAGVLTYTDEGPREAPALIAVHGIPGSVRDFRYLAPQVTEHVRFVRLDLPGFGGSVPEDAGVRTLEGRARAVLDLADHLGLARFAIVGHSMGGGTALLTAAGSPERVSAIVLIASLGLTTHRGLGMAPRTFRAFGRALEIPVLRDFLVPLMRVQYRKRRFPGADRMTAAEFAVQLRAIGAADFAAMRRAVTSPLPRALHAYACDDHMVETHISEALAAALSSVRVLRFEEGGHNIQKTRAVEIGRAIREMVAEL